MSEQETSNEQLIDKLIETVESFERTKYEFFISFAIRCQERDRRAKRMTEARAAVLAKMQPSVETLLQTKVLPTWLEADIERLQRQAQDVASFSRILDDLSYCIGKVNPAHEVHATLMRVEAAMLHLQEKFSAAQPPSEQPTLDEMQQYAAELTMWPTGKPLPIQMIEVLSRQMKAAWKVRASQPPFAALKTEVQPT